MKTIKELKTAIENNVPLIWNDPDPIEGNDYTISFIQNNDNFDGYDKDSPILIQYNDGMSEAEVFLHEIVVKK